MKMYLNFIIILCVCVPLKSELIIINDNDMISEGIFYKDDITHEIFSNKIVLKFNSPVIDISDGERYTDVDGISNQFPIIKNYFKSLNSTHGIVSIKKNILGASADNLYKNHIRTGQPIPIPDLSQLFTIEFNTPVNLTQIINEIKIFEEVNYAHETPSYIFLDSPNDEHYQNETNDYAASHLFMIDSLVTNSKVIINENNDIYTVYKKKFLNQGFSRGYAQKYTVQGDSYWEQPVGIFENEFFDFDFEVINENMYVLWNDLITTFMSSHIYTTHISSNGNILIESLVEQDGDYAEIDLLGMDTILTLWANNHSLGPSDAQFISQIFDLDFQPLEEPNNITPNSIDPNMENYYGIGLCVNQSNATYMVCWKDTRNGGYDLYGHIFNLNGESLSGSFKINEYELGSISDSQWHFTIKEYGDGYIIPFVMDRENDELDGIYLNEIIFENDSVNILPHFKKHLDLIYPASGEITMDIGSNGYSYVIWHQYIPNETTQLNGIIIDPNLNVIGNNWEISSIDAGYIFYPSISTNDDYLVCSWEEYVSQTEFIANIAVYSLDSLFANVGVENNFLPISFLLNAYPNPFNSNISIDLDIGKAGLVKVMIYNIMGEQVTQITNTSLNPGKYHFIWNGKNGNGISLPSGIYFIYSNIQDQTEIQKITLLK
ncbi:MAG: T9SS type A sorting domain-containing protein [Candidatus Marinimicrobia bacterium]|nr:T9SS type A sorting domain-containing protein [Candidatus Neomarinimicrobiota bacterium]